ncbi:hypothetical protein B0T22DRAFT_131208 [Podospora appendiculata]|uniref:SET domain-containing protein n=1 Tax=Podospora appendiculata TaxID=314037 RepID=A0AAE0X7Q1_9PEZI|nr:hypothetical protein B0T22DRAFT_131208 [Podospora appendiculata]
MMTDKLPPLSTPIVPPRQTLFSLPTAAPVQEAPRRQEITEEEPYTIKCICNFTDDDGNTILCEKCDTWQHIECYYPDNVEDALREDFAHFCTDCKPRALDRQQAIERQTARTTLPTLEEEATDKKTKRPPSKSHKKKPKPTDLPLNGQHAGPEKHASPHEHSHPPKKPKTSHKPSQSISSQAPKRSPSFGTNKANHAHPPSPVTTPPDLPVAFEIHNYSSSFLSLCNDQGVQIVRTNSFAGLQVSNAMSEWLRDPDKMEKETGLVYSDVFQKLPPDIDALKKPLDIERTEKAVSPNITLRWQYLQAPSAIGKDVPLMELNGQIGFQASYCANPQNRWDEFTSPLPFVLFHPMLPLYIDTRKEGSEARFVRRSCRPNAVLETYLSDGREYHFWLVSDRQIAAKEQITIPWDFRLPKKDKARILGLLGLGDEETSGTADPTIDEIEYQRIASWVHLVLSEHGGCACNLGTECAFARFHRNHLAKMQIRSNPPKSKKRKPKAQHTISPTSTGHATNSRAASEGRAEDVPEGDARSVSGGSSRSKPPSRDMTPTQRQGSFDTLGILTEPTDRDKRKVTMIEDSFRRMEQQHQQPAPRKRKRISDGTGSSKTTKSSKGGSANHTPTLPNEFPERHYVDAGTSRSKSGSPASTTSIRAANSAKSATMASRPISDTPRGVYCDAAVQTEPEKVPVNPPKQRFVSLSKRLLSNRHRVRDELPERQSQSSAPETPPVAMDVDTPTSQNGPVTSPPLEKEAEPAVVTATNCPSDDTPMPDAPAVSPTITRPSEVQSRVKPIKTKSPDLRVQMPPVPAFGSPASAPSTSTTPLSAGASTVQSPFSTTGLPSPFALSVNGITATASPVKKKLSLSDYTKSRMNKVAASRPSVGTTLLKPLPSSDEPKSAASVDNGGLLDSPTTEKSTDTPTSSTALLGAIPSTNGSV